MHRTLLLPALVGIAPLAGCDDDDDDVFDTGFDSDDTDDTDIAPWSYTGATGPDHWGDLDPAYAACGDGREQSPIDLGGPTPTTGLEPLRFDYQPGGKVLLNDTHTWKVKFGEGSTVRVGEDVYGLVELHAHAPAEHAVDGHVADFELHLVHEDAAGHLAAVGILFDEGAESPFFASFWDEMPRTPGEIPVPSPIDPADVLPTDLRYVTYPGSLTTPPCTEGLRWLVLTARETVSAEQIAALVDTFGETARPLQPLNGRTVRLSPEP